MEISRRRFLAGLGLIVGAPAIVRVSSIMPVKTIIRAPRTWYVSGPAIFSGDGRSWHYPLSSIKELMPRMAAGDIVYISATHCETMEFNALSAMKPARIIASDCMFHGNSPLIG